MRTILVIVLVFLYSISFGQDKQLLQKQLIQIMTDYPNHFKNLRDKTDSFYLNFEITGTEKGSMILTFDQNTCITSFLQTPTSDAEAKKLFDQWVALINSIDLNGAKLVTKPSQLGKFEVFNHQWRFDNSNNRIAANYLSFTIEIMILKLEGAFAASLKIGDL